MNEEEIRKALEIIKEPITVNCIEYKYFNEENYNKLLKVYENCLWFANNLEQINLTVKQLKQEKQELIDYLKEKENELQKKVVYYEKQLKGTERSSFYYSSYLKNVHKLNAQRELIKEILSKIEKE